MCYVGEWSARPERLFIVCHVLAYGHDKWPRSDDKTPRTVGLILLAGADVGPHGCGGTTIKLKGDVECGCDVRDL